MNKRSWFRPSWLALGVAMVSLTLAFACGGGQNAAVKSSNDNLAPPDQQVLRLRLTGEPASIDPALANTTSESTLDKSLFSGLFTYDQNLKVVPALASEMPTTENGGISKDGMTYTIKLDKDAKWSDGQPVTASDLVYGLKRALDPKLGSPYVSFFYGIVGAQEYNTALTTNPNTSDDTLASLRDQVGVVAKDADTVVYQLKQPNPSFLNQLALWTAYPVRQDIVEKYGAKWTEAGNLVGDGPFMLKEWTHNERIVFVPNPYWAGDKPKLSSIVVNFIADDAAAYAAYLNNELDEVSVPAANLKDVSDPASPLNAQLMGVPDLVTYAFFMNEAQAPFDNLKVRQAFEMAIDRNAWVSGVLQGAGHPTTSWLPPGMPGYDPSLGSNYAFDPAKAKQMLADAGYPNGVGLPPISFLATATDANRVVGQFIEDQLKQNLGITVTTEYVDSKTKSTRFTNNQYQITVQSWSADWPYPDNWLPDLFSSQGLNNHLNFHNAAFDQLISKAAAETDDAKRLTDYGDAQKLLLDQAAIVPLYNKQSYILVKPNVRNLVFTAVDGAIKGDYHFDQTYIAAN